MKKLWMMAAHRDMTGCALRSSVLLACFLLAGLAACVTVSSAGQAGSSAMESYLEGYLQLAEADAVVSPSLLEVCWELCRWCLLVVLLGSTALGILAVPAVFCVRGYLLGYSVASFARVFGPRGILLALAVFGMTALLALPAFFCVGVSALTSSADLAAGAVEKKPAYGLWRDRLLSLTPGLVLLALSAAAEWSVVPKLLSAAVHLLRGA